MKVVPTLASRFGPRIQNVIRLSSLIVPILLFFAAFPGLHSRTLLDEVSTSDPALGYNSLTNYLDEPPVAICVNTPIIVQLNADGMVSIGVELVDNGSYDVDFDPLALSLSQSDFYCADIGSNTVTLSVSDGTSISTCTSEIIVQDTLPPVLYCQDIFVRLDAYGFVSITAEDMVVGVLENCALDDIYASQEDFYCNDVGKNPIILYASDVNGNITTCDAHVYVDDIFAPGLECQSLTITLGDDGNASINPDMVISYINDACGIGFLGLSQSDFNCSDVGDNPVTLTAIDNNGNVSECAVTISVIDVTSPAMSCNNVTVLMNEFGNAFITPELINGGIFDACGLLTMYLDNDMFSCYLGEYNVTLTAIDVSFNLATCDAVVTVVGADEDCDTVHDACDLCNGGNDLIDNNLDGTPDCSQALSFDDYSEDWQCRKGKILICHNGRRKCVRPKSIARHLRHGDYVGPCNDANCHVALSVENSDHFDTPDVAFRLYPNPAIDMVQIEVDQLKDMESRVFIQNQLGEIVHQRKLDSRSGKIREMIDISGFSTGIYYIRIMDGEDSVVRKLIIVH